MGGDGNNSDTPTVNLMHVGKGLYIYRDAGNWIAHLKCQNCLRQWHRVPGPHECPFCGHLYIDWLNYPIEKEKYCRICDGRHPAG